tara:strand:- start:624 stop:815 length:192 start_codon:yes stop_codon:yes gene_type:complete
VTLKTFSYPIPNSDRSFFRDQAKIKKAPGEVSQKNIIKIFLETAFCECSVVWAPPTESKRTYN